MLDDSLLMASEVESMYPNIDNINGLLAVREVMENYAIYDPVAEP